VPVREVLDYAPETDDFRWRINKGTRAPAGSIAGTLDKRGYRFINIDGMPYPAQRLAVLFMTGEWPKGVVDHRNGDRACNALWNLRDCTIAQNNLNRKFRGCTWNRRDKRWISQIIIDGKQHRLGHFKTEAEATAAYRKAAAEAHGEFSVTARPAEPELRRAA